MYKKTIWDVYDQGLRGFDMDRRPEKESNEHGAPKIAETVQHIEKIGAAAR